MTCNEWCDSLWQKKTHQATACLLVQWLCCCPPPSLPYFASEPTWQTLHRSILKLFLLSFWYQPQGSGVTRAKAVRFVALPAVPSLVTPKSEHTQRTSCAKCGSNLIRELSQLLPKWVSAFVPVWGEKKRKRKEKERIKVLIVKHLAAPGGNESRVFSEITDGDVTEVHFPAAH